MKLFTLFFICLITAGCIILPLGSTLLDKEAINQIEVNKASQQEVISIIGQPTLKLDSDNIWLYVGVNDAAVMMSNGVYYMQEFQWIFMRFNKANILIEKEVFEKQYGCTASGYCLVAGWERGEHDKYTFNRQKAILLPPEDESSENK